MLTVVREAAHSWLFGISARDQLPRKASAQTLATSFFAAVLGMPTPNVGNPNARDAKLLVSD